MGKGERAFFGVVGGSFFGVVNGWETLAGFASPGVFDVVVVLGDKGTVFLFFLSDYFWWWGPGHTHFVVEFSSERQK